eukprot:IDg5535t1
MWRRSIKARRARRSLTWSDTVVSPFLILIETRFVPPLRASMARLPRFKSAYREHWLFGTDDAVHQPPHGTHGYHVVAYHECGVRLDWKRVFATEYFSSPPVEYEYVPGMILEGPWAFHHPESFWRLNSLRTDAELFAFAPWFDPGVVSSPPRWLLGCAENGFFPGDMAISTELVPSPTYRRGVCVEIDEFTARHRRDPATYCRALFLQRYFHVRRPALRADGLENHCDEWLVCADWEPDYVRRVTGMLLQVDLREPNVRHPRDLRASLDFMCLPRLLDERFRSRLGQRRRTRPAFVGISADAGGRGSSGIAAASYRCDMRSSTCYRRLPLLDVYRRYQRGSRTNSAVQTDYP